MTRFQRLLEIGAAPVKTCVLFGAGTLALPCLAQADDDDAAWVGSDWDLRRTPSQLQYDQRILDYANFISNLENKVAEQESELRRATQALDSAATPWREARDAYKKAVAAAEQSPWDGSLTSAARRAYEAYERAVAAANSLDTTQASLREDVARAEAALVVARVALYFGKVYRQRFEYDYDAHQEGCGLAPLPWTV